MLAPEGRRSVGLQSDAAARSFLRPSGTDDSCSLAPTGSRQAASPVATPLGPSGAPVWRRPYPDSARFSCVAGVRYPARERLSMTVVRAWADPYHLLIVSVASDQPRKHLSSLLEIHKLVVARAPRTEQHHVAGHRDAPRQFHGRGQITALI